MRDAVFVIGGVNMDILGTPRAPLLMRDSNPGTVTLRPGGVGRNIAWGLKRLGAPVELVSAVGDDAFGAALRKSLLSDGIGSAHLFSNPGASGVYLCLHDADGDMVCAINQMEAVETISPARLATLLPALNSAPLVVLDANLPGETLAYLAEHCTAKLFADPVSAAKAPRMAPAFPRLAAFKPNRLEAGALSGEDCADAAGLSRAADFFLARGVKRVYISLGAEGVYYAGAEGWGTLPSLARVSEGRDTTGAGDAMTAALALGELRGLPIADCARLGLAAARQRILTGTLDGEGL